jgi:hypothetical protein
LRRAVHDLIGHCPYSLPHNSRALTQASVIGTFDVALLQTVADFVVSDIFMPILNGYGRVVRTSRTSVSPSFKWIVVAHLFIHVAVAVS